MGNNKHNKRIKLKKFLGVILSDSSFKKRGGAEREEERRGRK